MVAYFVRYYISFGGLTGCLETVLQFVKKRKVEIDAVVGRTIKRSGCRRGKSAGRIYLPV